ncbi:hypothetical protein [Terriglobus sp. TAA 43]|uniref:hypothetical protein n=1 Tax=Terriglobus sp. TAA 43 TaxID=278961 RepID=UPI000646503A|nr:hypothetical protein [Terriglobus sp. TAA 43]
MILRIDNNDGAGEVDYTPAVRTDMPLEITRNRGKWTVCSAGLDLAGSGLVMPQSRSQMRVLDSSGAVLFHGILEATSRASCAMAGTNGSDDCVVLRAVEMAWLTQGSPSDALQPATSMQHAMALHDVTLKMDATSSLFSDLAQDVMVSGEYEPTQYVTELFRGDGATASFALQHAPFRESGNDTLLDDAFDGSVFDSNVWSRVDVASYLSLGSGGLRMNGGTGADGATLLSSKTPVELGGGLVAEASDVMLTAGSDGVLLGFYDGTTTRNHCTAGVRVRGTAGSHSLVAIVNGVEQTSSYDFANGHRYVLRVRLHCAEMQRIRSRYGVLVDGVLQQFGGDSVGAPMHVVIEVADLGLASSTLPTVLYDGAMAISPYQCVFAPVNSVALNGSVGRVTLTRTGSCLVVSTAADGTQRTRRQGVSTSGADYVVGAAGVVTFAAGLLPQPGELVTVRYRRRGRAVARVIDDTAEFVRESLGLPGMPAWSGEVRSPLARSSADCESAAKALLALSAGSATGISGSVTWLRNAALAADVAPGDTLLIASDEGTQTLPVQSVRMVDGNCDPEQVTYTAAFRQGRDVSLDFHVGDGLAADVPGNVAVVRDVALPVSLAGLQVTAATTAALQVDSGVDAPDGCGFEVRRSDANFGLTTTSDLVLRSAARGFSIPRAAFAERFFVRMYDNSVPAKYSAVSSVVLTSLPVS